MKDIIPAKKQSPILGLTGMGGGVGSNLGGSLAETTYMEDVFSTYLYKGTGSDVSVNNGIDLSGEGGLVWIKSRTSTQYNSLVDTARGATKAIFSNHAMGEDTGANGYMTSFNNNGFTTGNYGNTSYNGTDYASWSFRKAKGFFDVVTYTGNGSARNISHSLGCVPGMILVKCTSHSADWAVYHRGTSSFPQGDGMYLNSNEGIGNIPGTDDWWDGNNRQPTSTTFGVGTNTRTNQDTRTYVAYLFAGGASGASEATSMSWHDYTDKLKCGDSSNTTADFNFGTGDLTIECWIKCNSTQGTYPRVVAIGPQWSAEMAAIQWDHDENSNRVSFYCYNHSSSTTDPLLKSSVKGFNGDGQWHHVAVSRNGNTWRLFVDGILEDDATWSGSPTSANSYCTIGNTPGTATTAWFEGRISNVRIVKGTAVYTSSFRVPTEPLTNVTNTVLLCCNSSSRTGATVAPITLTEVSLGDPTSESPFDDPDAFKFGENGDQNVIKCGSYTTDLNEDANLNLGWEPQWLLVKRSDSNSGGPDWLIYDSMRGFMNAQEIEANNGGSKSLSPNLTDTENDNSRLGLTSTGAYADQYGSNRSFIYVAIRRPDGLVGKPAEAGTDVFAMDTGNSSTGIPNFDSGFPVDYALLKEFNGTAHWHSLSRLTGDKYVNANQTASQQSYSNFKWDSNEGWYDGNVHGSIYQSWMWKRHAGFDVVTWSGDGVSGRQIPHSMGKTPEMMWVKRRNSNDDWTVYHYGQNGGTNPEQYRLRLNENYMNYTGTSYWNNTLPTSTSFTLGNDGTVNSGGTTTYIGMLFASVDGICKCGSYDGTGSEFTVTTGFQPRFVIIKAYNNNRGWTVLDTQRGWGAGVDNKIMLNLDAAQVNTWNYGEPTSTGFKVSPDPQYDINYTGWKYIYYAHA